MENIKVYIRVKPSNEKANKSFEVISNNIDNNSSLLNLKTGENFVYGKKKKLYKYIFCDRSSYSKFFYNKRNI